MRTAFILALCLMGYVSATSDSYAWKVGKQYVYKVDGRLMAGISKINTQYAGLQLKYKIIVTVIGPNRLNLNPVELKAVDLNEEIEGGWRDGQLRGEREAQIPHQLREYIESPIEITLKKGVVDSIQVQGDLPTWAINMKKAQASILTLDSTGDNAIVNGNLNRHASNNVRPEQHSGYFYETMEETVHGECETYYTVNEHGALEPPYPVTPKQQSATSDSDSESNSDSNSSSDESNESRRRGGRPYMIYKKLAQRQDSESFEDSQEVRDGELPWPKSFQEFCHNGQEVYEIVKAVNFTSCKQKPVLAYVTPSELYCRPGDNTCGNLWNRVVITRYLACGTSRRQFTILRMSQEERVHFGIRETQKTLVGTVKNITLIEIKDGGKPEHVKNPRTINNLVFQFSPKEQRNHREGKLRYAEPSEQYESKEYRRHLKRYQSQSESSSSSSSSSSSGSSSTSEESEEYQRDAPYLHKRWNKLSRNSKESFSAESSEEGIPLSSEKPSMRQAPLNPLLITPLDKQGMLQRVQELMREVVKDLQQPSESYSVAERETLSKVFTVSKILRRLDYDDIYRLYNEIATKKSTQEEQTARQIFLDAIAIAGTNPNHLVLFELIKKQNLVGERAAQILMTLPMYVRTPTVEYLKEYFGLVKETLQFKHRQVKTTAILSFSNILYQACINSRTKQTRFPVALYGEFCDVQTVEEFLPFYLEKLEQHWKSDSAEDKHYTVVFLNALGNIGHPKVIEYIQRILDQSPSSFLKMKAIFALKHLIVSRQVQNIPEKMKEVIGVDRQYRDLLTDELIEKRVLPILVAVAHDRSEHPEVRMAAISLLWYTTPADITVWQHLAYSTWFEKSQEVQSFIYSSLKSLARENRPITGINWRMQKKARAVLSLAKPILPGIAKSRNLFTSAFVDELSTGYSAHLSYYGSKDSLTPNNLYFRNFYQFGNGGLGVNPLEFSVHGHSVHKIVAHLIQRVTRRKNQDIRMEHQDLEFIRKELGIQTREQEEPIQGTLHFKIRNEMERLFSVNEQTINNIISKLKSKAVQNIRSNDGFPFNFQKVFVFAEHVMSMPSSFGLPIVYKFHMPVTVSLRGAVSLNGDKQGDLQVQTELHPVYSWKSHASIAVKVPFTGKKYQAGVQRHFVVDAPFRALLTKTESGLLKMAITPTQLKSSKPSGKIDLITYHQKPYTAIITDELYPVIYPRGGVMKVVRSTETPVDKKITVGNKKFGLNLNLLIKSDYDKEAEGQSAWVRYLKKFHTPGCWFNVGWIGAPTLKRVERKIVLDLDKSATNTFVIMLAGQRRSNQLRSILGESSESSSSSSSESSESQQSRSFSSSLSKESSQSDSDSSSSSSSSSEERVSRFAKKLKLNRVTENTQEHPEKGRVVAIALLGKKAVIPSIRSSKGVQTVLQGPTTVQYLLQVTKVPQKVYIRLAAGEAANEAAALLPSSIQKLAKHIITPSNSKEQPRGCINFEGYYDAPTRMNRHVLVVLRKTLLEQDLKVKVEGSLQFGRSCKNLQHKIRLEGDLKRGPKMTQWAKELSPEAQRCKKDEQKGFHVSPICLKVAEHQAAALNIFDIQLQHSQMPIRVRNATYHVRDFLKAYLYPYMSHDYYPRQSVEQGRMDLRVRLTPNKEYLSIFITRHNSVLKFQNIKTGRIIKKILPLTATQSLLNNVRDRVLRTNSEPMCALQNTFISTFDNITYRFNPEVAEGCTHVLTKDCTGKQPIAVLVKNINSKSKTVTVLLPGQNKVRVVPQSSQQYKVQVNNQEVSLPHYIHSHQNKQRIIARIERIPVGGIQIINRKIRVATDGDKVVVFGSVLFRNRTCGLCGDFNGEKTADMKSPKNCPLSSGSLLVASYAFQGKDSQEKCKIEPKFERQIKEEERICRESGLKSAPRVRSYFNSDESSSESSSSSSESREQYKYKITRDGKKLRKVISSEESSSSSESRPSQETSEESSSSSESYEPYESRRRSSEERRRKQRKGLFDESSSSSSSSSSESAETCFTKMQYVTEDPKTSNKICFSLKKMPYCKQSSRCTPKNLEHKNIEFLCFPRNTETRKIEQRILDGHFVDLEQELPKFNTHHKEWISVKIPETCRSL